MQQARTLRRQAMITALAVLLVSCGGGDVGDAPDAAESATLELEALDATERQALAALRPEFAPGNEHFIVTLNAAAVAENERANARTLGAGSPQTLAERAVQSVTARLMGAPTSGARAHRIYAHALQGFAATVPTSDVADFLQRVQNDPAVVRIEYDRVATITTTAATPAVVTRAMDSQTWGLDRIDQLKLPLNNTFRNSLDGSGVHVYIVDTGISVHDDFGSRLASEGYDAIQDGRGTTDCHGHGTHVAGTAGGTRSGVAPGATLVPVRVLNCGGSGSLSDILQGLDWIMAHGIRPGVVNLSLGSSAATALDEAVARIANAGFTMVVSAGNSNTDACTQSPARTPSALTIAASTSTDVRSGFSNYGRCVDLFAPGSAISSAANTDPHGWTIKSGTSMSSPHVTGAAALLLQERPKLTPVQVASQMLYQASSAVITDAKGSPNKLLFAGAGKQLYFPTPWIVHVAQLSPLGKDVTRSSWNAGVTVTVHNEDGLPQKSVKVTGQFSNRSNLVACTTTAAGTCVLRSVNLPLGTAGLTFAVTQLSGTAMTYKAADNLRSSTPIVKP
ncbi:S8 family peptidase [Sphaerotilus sp.]|uniref:S8 family peptidase n=1 Tax=Sphaerotilus sp. TaxID=2093942 RepID=UPI00286DB0DB|nr:S8 family peptidase [Sphaerotilus sp.]